jgi:RNase P/RNase MRP subunit POP5
MNSQEATKHAKKCQLIVQTDPKIKDPRELNTILVSSIRSLFGEFEHHSSGMKVVQNDDDSETTDDSFIIECPPESLSAIRSALTMVTPPLYLDSKIFRFDVVEVRGSADVLTLA